MQRPRFCCFLAKHALLFTLHSRYNHPLRNYEYNSGCCFPPVIIFSSNHDFKNGLFISIRYQIFTKVNIHIVVLQVISPCCSMAEEYDRIGDICCIHLQEKPLDVIIYTHISFKHLTFLSVAVDFRPRPKSGPWGPM
jgi:hypothetical protein